jgi:hypothetical protein
LASCQSPNQPTIFSDEPKYSADEGLRWRLDVTEAKHFVKAIDLPRTLRGIPAQDAVTEAGEVFDEAKTQAQVVGAGVFSFAEGVTERRERGDFRFRPAGPVGSE